MKKYILENPHTLGKAAAQAGAQALRIALATKPKVAIIVATGASQFEMLDALVHEPDIDWSRVTAFHLDEYIGLPYTHPASFRRYLQERFVARLPHLGEFVGVDGSALDIPSELERLNSLIIQHPIDICFAGIGENGHLAFNDPPADFETTVPYLVVQLDRACRQQQLGEGWFSSLEAVPQQAISMSIQHIMASAHIILSVPDSRKAQAVKACLEGAITPLCPASILQQHPHCEIFLDAAAASTLSV